jgi:2-(1,2-epoxy-1,2-dihydrophenyl)acetyl-CoA isomerase
MCLLLERDGSVLVVTLNRPEKLNALNWELHDALSSAWSEAADPAVRAIVLTGAGRGFCSGADLTGAAPPDGRVGGLRQQYNPHVLALAALDKPVLAAVNGVAAGAGLALAAAADIRIASSAARFVPAFLRIGVVPDAGASYFLTRILGYHGAFDFFTANREVSAEQALAVGLVNEVVAPDAMLGRAVERAHAIANLPGSAAGLTRRLLAAVYHNDLATQLELEATLQAIAVADPARAAARAAVVAGMRKDPTPSSEEDN